MTDITIYPWYVLRLRSNFEKKADDCLRSKGFTTYLPLYRTRRKLSDRMRELDLPLFPGYTFCSFDSRQKLPVVTTPGVVSILESASGPIPVPESEISAVQTMLKSGTVVGPWPFLREGQRVVVERGPLQGLEGFVLKVKENYRLVVSVPLLQRSVAAEIDQDWVRPISVRTMSRTPLNLLARTASHFA